MKQLRYFVAVAGELNFTRAARRLHLSQPALSVQIRNLERDLGVDLLRRTSRSVEHTDAGRGPGSSNLDAGVERPGHIEWCRERD